MGIMDFLKGELLEIIEWTDDSRDTLSFRFPMRTRPSSAVHS
jgi:membrane protease subunit (stomatin/prohibitin family)